MVPCCECHPSQDHVTQKRVQCACPKAQLARRGGRGNSYCVSLYLQKYQLSALPAMDLILDWSPPVRLHEIIQKYLKFWTLFRKAVVCNPWLNSLTPYFSLLPDVWITDHDSGLKHVKRRTMSLVISDRSPNLSGVCLPGVTAGLALSPALICAAHLSSAGTFEIPSRSQGSCITHNTKERKSRTGGDPPN